MIAGPVFRLELLTIGRRSRYFITRVVYGLGLLTALWLCYMEAFPAYQRDQGRTFQLADYPRLAQSFFAAFAGIQLGLILLVTPAMTAGTVAIEHERRTIDYLLTTQLSDSEITLSKFLARMAAIILQLLVGLPVMLLVMLFGGIRTETIVQVFGYSLCVLIATASLSLWISASSRNSRAAITSAYFAVIALGGIPPALATFLHEGLNYRTGFVGDACAAVVAWNPIALIALAFEPERSFMPWYHPEYIVPIYLGSAAVWLGLAVRALRRTYVRAAGAAAGSGGLVGAIRRLASGSRLLPASRRRPVGSRAMLWKELISQQRAIKLGWVGTVAGLLLFGSAYFGLGASIYAMMEEESRAANGGYSWYGSATADPLGYHVPFHRASLHFFSVYAEAVAGSFVLLLVTARAAGSVTVEREQDTWLTLISTPTEGRSIAMAKIVGAIYSVRYWYLFLMITWVCCSIRYPSFATLIPVLLISHLLFAWVCAAVGVFFSARCKTSLWAIGSALSTVVLVGGGLPLLLTALIAIGARTHGPPMPVGFILPVTLGAIDMGVVEQWSRSRVTGGDIDVYHWALVAHVVYATLALLLTFAVDVTFDTACGRMSTRFNYEGAGFGYAAARGPDLEASPGGPPALAVEAAAGGAPQPIGALPDAPSERPPA